MTYINAEMLKYEMSERGYVLLSGVFQGEVLQNLREKFDSFYTEAMQNPRDRLYQYYPHHKRSGVLYEIYQRSPDFRRAIDNEKLISALSIIADSEDLLLIESSALSKRPELDAGVPFHQDFCDAEDVTNKYVIWIALDDVLTGQGELKVVEGSHKEGFLEYETIENATHHKRLINEPDLRARAQSVEVKGGDILIFNNKLVHGSDAAVHPLGRRTLRFAVKTPEDLWVPRGSPIILSRASSNSKFDEYVGVNDRRFQLLKQDIKSMIKRFIWPVGRL